MPEAKQKPGIGRGSSSTAAMLTKALDLLHTFNEDHFQMTVSQLAAASGEPSSTMYRYVKFLSQQGLLEESGTDHTYRPGLRLLNLARALKTQLKLAAAAIMPMEQVSRQCGETVLLTVPYGNQVMCLERVESGQRLRISYEPGMVLPYHAAGPSKVLLSYQPKATVDAVIASGLRRFTDATITDPEVLAKQLEQIRGAGYATSVGELDRGIGGLAVPVFGRTGVVGALGLAAPVERLPARYVEDWLELFHSGSRAIQQQISQRENAQPDQSLPSQAQAASNTIQEQQDEGTGDGGLARVLNVLFALHETGAASLGELASRHQVPATTLRRHLQLLCDAGLVSHDGGRRYRLGLRILELARPLFKLVDIVHIALPAMRELSNSTRETVVLSGIAGDRVVCLERVDRGYGLRSAYDRGTVFPFYAGALGKAILAFQRQENIERILNARIPDPQQLKAELCGIRAVGCAVSLGEHDSGVGEIAAPVLDPFGYARAALTVAAPRSRLNPERIQELKTLVVLAAESVSRFVC